MILNVYALLAGSIDLLRLILGGLTAALAWVTWRNWRASPTREPGTVFEDRLYLLSLLVCFLFGLNLVSWPLFYLVLQSYVPEWPGVMCVYGVTRIGVGSEGASRFLTLLLQLLQLLKPAAIYVTGVAFILYQVHRRSRTGALLGRTLAVLLLVGVASSTDAAVESAYLIIPKKHEVLAAGCCTVSGELDEARDRREGRYTEPQRAWLAGAFYAVGLGMLLALRRYRDRAAAGQRLPAFGPLLLLAGAALVVGAAFLTEVFAPAVLGLPYHRCAYDLISGAPETLLGVGLFAWGTLCAGWAAAANLARTPETAGAIPSLVASLLQWSAGGYFYSLVLATSALWVAG
jgi:hypothetical protein